MREHIDKINTERKLDFANLPSFQDLTDKEGRIYLNGERIILTSSSVFGILRKDLKENISEQRMKGFLIRYGWNLGKLDAQRVLKQRLSSIEQILRQGPVLHMIRGYTKVQRTNLNIDYDPSGKINAVHVEGIWTGSYEAEEHLRQFGVTNEFICHTLVGYASGYYSEICRRKVIFKETSCKAAGSSYCYYVGKTIPEWKDDIVEELKYYEDNPIVEELAITYEKLLEERNNLAKTFIVHQQLTEKLVEGEDIPSIAELVHQKTQLPIMIDNTKHNLIAHAGFGLINSLQHYQTFLEALQQEEAQDWFKIRRVSYNGCQFLTSPIMLKKKYIGSCTFVYGENEQPTKVDQMILERTATVCSLYMLNEKTTFEAMERMKGHFLDQIIDGSIASKKEMIKRGSYLQVDLDQNYFIVAINYEHTKNHSRNELVFHEQVMEHVLNYFKTRSNMLIGQRSSTIILLIQIQSSASEVYTLCSHLKDNLHEHFSNRMFTFGISTIGLDVKLANDHYHEALTALSMATRSKSVMLFEDLSVVGMLIHSKNKDAIKQKAKHLLGPLYQDKDRYKELLKTLYVFLSNGGNLEKSMKELALSMSGLRYRVKQLEEILGEQLRDPAVSHQLLLTLEVLLAKSELSFE